MKAYGSSEDSGLPFSEAIEACGLVFVSGQIPMDEEGNLVEGDIETKTHQVMKNIERVLKSAGLNFSNVVKAEIFLTDIENREKVSRVYSEYLSQPNPARVALGVKELPFGVEVEIAMIAARE